MNTNVYVVQFDAQMEHKFMQLASCWMYRALDYVIAKND